MQKLPEAVVDTVVLMYFLLVQEAALLLELLGTPIAVPRIVYDPDEEATAPNSARSEVMRSVEHQRWVASSTAGHEAAQAATNAERLQSICTLHTAGALTIVDLRRGELRRFSSLTSPSGCKAFNLRFPLQAGEAACLAIAVERDLVLATDDSDALKAMAAISNTHRYQRIRKLLITAANNGRISQARANAIHAQMRRLGFWDKEPPFPYPTQATAVRGCP